MIDNRKLAEKKTYRRLGKLREQKLIAWVFTKKVVDIRAVAFNFPIIRLRCFEGRFKQFGRDAPPAKRSWHPGV